jgi:hypothetical protein
MELLRRNAGLRFEPLLYLRPGVLERIFPGAPVMWDARFSVMRRPDFAGLPRCSKTCQEVGEWNLIRCCSLLRRRAGSAALGDALLGFLNRPGNRGGWLV